jgi:hypothetical protein
VNSSTGPTVRSPGASGRTWSANPRTRAGLGHGSRRRARSSKIRLSGQRHNQHRTYTDRRHEYYASQRPINLGTSTFESATTGICSDRHPAPRRELHKSARIDRHPASCQSDPRRATGAALTPLSSGRLEPSGSLDPRIVRPDISARPRTRRGPSTDEPRMEQHRLASLTRRRGLDSKRRRRPCATTSFTYR